MKNNPTLDIGPSIGLLALRLFAGLRIIYGVMDNVISYEKMKEFEVFLAQFHFPFPHISAVVSVYVQLICGILILVGYKTKWASAFLVLNFLMAIFMVHVPIGDTVEATTPALALLVISLCLFFTGSGKISVEHLIKTRF